MPAAVPSAPQRGGVARPHATPKTHRAPMGEAPRAPWSPFPLVELCVLVAIVLIVLGFVTDGPRRTAFLACGIALASLAGLELAIREHFAGFRSHTALLAGAGAVVVVVPLYFLTGLPQVVLLAVGVIVYSLGFVALRRAFQSKTGGIGFRV
jgi:predicted membrane channel-forming protein YqfA (hemolysin III family)